MPEPMVHKTIRLDDGSQEKDCTQVKVRIPTRLVRQFEEQAEALAKTLEEIRTFDPHANGYLQEDTMNLMAGQSHVGTAARPQTDAVVVSIYMAHFDGGGW